MRQVKGCPPRSPLRPDSAWHNEGDDAGAPEHIAIGVGNFDIGHFSAKSITVSRPNYAHDTDMRFFGVLSSSSLQSGLLIFRTSARQQIPFHNQLADLGVKAFDLPLRLAVSPPTCKTLHPMV
ncbi:hypothetical protein SAMN05519104_5688 [Rhizobiales bacterium GAS188]|nr:hypothetical protein SAMN05519104_5688 [Rhizobiales bacterium GAS188]